MLSPLESLRSVSRLVGNTPLLGLRFRFDCKERVIYAKCEHLNLTGSIKDRMALFILKRAYTEGAIRPGDTIAEATSGNTGIAFAALGRLLGHPVTIFIPDWMSQERIQLIRSYGADVVLVSESEGGFLGCIRRAGELAAARKDVFLPKQFSNEANAEAHAHTTGPEIWMQLSSAGLSPDAFVAGVGTGGTVMGVGRFLHSRTAGIRVHPVEPLESPILTGRKQVRHHRIQGISDEFIPDIVKLDELDEVLDVADGDAILMAQKLASRLGLGVGISSGCNVIAAIKAQEKLGPEAVVVTVLPDDNRKYLSTDLLKVEPVQEGYISPRVELLGVSSFGRVCQVCEESEKPLVTVMVN